MIRAAAFAVVIAGPMAARASCVDVKIGDQQYFDCLNRDLASYANGRRASALDAPGLNQSGPALGVFNQAAERERLGSSFGKSLVPQRIPRFFAPPPLGGR